MHVQPPAESLWQHDCSLLLVRCHRCFDFAAAAIAMHGRWLMPICCWCLQISVLVDLRGRGQADYVQVGGERFGDELGQL